MQSNDRLRRLVCGDVDECREGAVRDRVAELEALEGSLPANPDRDLQALKALSNDTRYRIVRYLASADEELCVCEFEPILDVGESAISHALSDLADAGLVDRRKEGKWRYYAPTDRALALVAALDDTRGGGR